jgi:hypothetical protein
MLLLQLPSTSHTFADTTVLSRYASAARMRHAMAQLLLLLLQLVP